MFSPVVVFESCLDVIISVIVYILTLGKVLSTMNWALEIETEADVEVFEHVIHDYKKSFVLFLLGIFPNYLMKAKEARD